MATLTKDNIEDIGSIVVQAIKSLVPQIINEQVPKIINEQVPKIINEQVPKIINDQVPRIINDQVPKIINEQVPRIIDERVPDIVRDVVREETADMREDIAAIKHVQGAQSLMLRTLTTDTTQIKETVRRQGVFYEDLEHRFTALGEAISDGLTTQARVQDHEGRLSDLETAQRWLKQTVREHAAYLNPASDIGLT